jgi:cyclophilin family peptidyl-prolyl cis-trans isomerase
MRSCRWTTTSPRRLVHEGQFSSSSFDDRPITRDNFLAYVNANRYNNSLMHRLDTISGPTTAILQGGGYYLQYQQEPEPLDNSLSPNFRVDLDGNPNTANPMITNEYLNAPVRVNAPGTIAMARTTDPNSATSEYFFNIGDNTTFFNETNGGGYAVFARVVGDGMNLLNAYTGLTVLKRNPDIKDDGTRDAGPFGTLPALVNGCSYLPLKL